MLQRIKEKYNKIGLYIRVSTDDQAKNGFSLDAQKDLLEQVIINNNIGGVHNTSYYIDDGHTGTNVNRPEFKRLLNDIKKGKINLVMATDAERVGRENEFNSFWLKYLKAFECELFLLENPTFDIKNDADILQYHVKSAFSEYEVKKIRKRAEAGIIRSFMEGNYATPGCPYGFKKIDKKLYPNDDQVAIVQLIHKLYLECYSIQAIQKYLQINEIGEKKWTEPIVRGILYDEIYIGKEYRKDLNQTFHLNIEYLVNVEDKNAVLKRLRQRTRTTIHKVKHIYKGIVYCYHCDKPCICDTQRRNGIEYRYYYCKSDKGCGRRINEDVITEDLNVHMLVFTTAEADLKTLRHIKNKLVSFRKQELATDELYNHGKISRRVYRVAKKEIAMQRREFINSTDESPKKAIIWENLSKKNKKKYINKFCSKIIIDLKIKNVKKLVHKNAL